MNNVCGPKSRIGGQGSQQKSRNLPFSSGTVVPHFALIVRPFFF